VIDRVKNRDLKDKDLDWADADLDLMDANICDQKAATLFQRAANKGSSRAMVALARCYLVGTGVLKDRSEAIAWLRKAAKENWKPDLDKLEELDESRFEPDPWLKQVHVREWNEF
jgi:TPR repeat protein